MPAACHTPLGSRKDAAAAQDAAVELPPSAPAPPELPVDALASPDVAAPEAPTYVPKLFRLVNHTAATAYVRVEAPVGCRREDGLDWQACSFFPLWCVPSCDNGTSGGNCCAACERRVPSLHAIGPGESRLVPWNGNTSARTTGTCSQCECQQATPVHSGTFEASASIYADYQCVSPVLSQPCQPIPGGIIDSAEPRGSHVTVTVPFSVPYADYEVVLDITSLPGIDAGITLDAAPADSGGIADAIMVVDGSPGRPATCQPLAYSHFGPVSGVSYCPVDPKLPECASSDVGAIVYRDETCAVATINAHPDCAPWSRPRGAAFVFLTDPFGGCGWPISLDSVLDCGEYVDITYSVTEPCQTCDAVHPSSVMLIIQDDTKPVRARASRMREEC